jgi:hypothetical protein
MQIGADQIREEFGSSGRIDDVPIERSLAVTNVKQNAVFSTPEKVTDLEMMIYL